MISQDARNVLAQHRQDDPINENVLDHDELSAADILEALASLRTTLVEDAVLDSTQSYYELLSEPDDGSDNDGS